MGIGQPRTRIRRPDSPATVPIRPFATFSASTAPPEASVRCLSRSDPRYFGAGRAPALSGQMNFSTQISRNIAATPDMGASVDVLPLQ
jgi:hypothetical protein